MNNSRLSIFGEVLFDQFPDGSHIMGGAPFNVAWHLQAFGQTPRFISRIGQDQNGEAIQTAMRAWQMDLSALQRDSMHPTGTVQVIIEQGEPGYHILPEQAYDYIAAGELDAKDSQGLLYHGSLALRNEVSRRALDVLKRRHHGKIFMDVNLRDPWWQKADVLRLLDAADWVKLNHHELQALQGPSTDIKTGMQTFQKAHDLEGLIVTCGEQGALAVTADGDYFAVAPVPALQVIDTVGAGDAFASVLLLGLNLGWPLQLTLERAQAFASALVGQRGASIDDAAFYQPFIQAWALA
ncbi:PfkB domain protein [Candidatus Methylobacter favarea]|uniref:PfkB domain protein n=1 Tax=Candidatus Methylobacter favarea TaxID=2707345 RepID=A0A8S0WPM6_9GAMM|nr:PfkB family carbohydrate kinase [Candidatus Methylobacter favarea]CAA9890995.1 PfkB domain protein [Candidatus Methylobacter favarea]